MQLNNYRNKDRALRELATLRLYVCNKERERHHTRKDKEILQTDRWNLIEMLKAKVRCLGTLHAVFRRIEGNTDLAMHIYS